MQTHGLGLVSVLITVLLALSVRLTILERLSLETNIFSPLRAQTQTSTGLLGNENTLSLFFLWNHYKQEGE